MDWTQRDGLVGRRVSLKPEKQGVSCSCTSGGGGWDSIVASFAAVCDVCPTTFGRAGSPYGCVRYSLFVSVAF